ncbi:phosphatidylethanolamine-binding protein [Phellopilus nigrolimitatus]|nr:phosphatidylethanolamine-binding protein [Phellopilus nigrolimitatus]
MFHPLLVAFSLVSFVLAQDTALQIEAIEAHFTNAGIVPDLLATFAPTAAMSVSFDGVGVIQPGQPLSQSQVSPTPSVTVASTNSSLGSNFTLAMVDAGPVGSDQSKGQTRHWLVNGVSLSGSNGNETVSNASATAITEYAGPAPPSGSGAHRYVILLYTQPSSFTPPDGLSSPNVGVSVFSLSDYVKSTGLEGPVAGMYFTVEVGTASSSPSATSAVETSTLPVPSSNGKGGTATGTGSASSQPGTSNGAFVVKSNGAALLLGAVLAVGFA